MTNEEMDKRARALAAAVFYQRSDETVRGVLEEFTAGKTMRGLVFSPVTEGQVEQCRKALASIYDAGVHDAWMAVETSREAQGGKVGAAIERALAAIKANKFAKPCP